MPRDLLCVIQSNDEPSAALSQTLAFVAGYNVNPTFVAVAPTPPPVLNFFGISLVEGLIADANNKAAEMANATEAQVLDAGRQQGFTPAVLKKTESLAEITASIEKSARCFDLTIIDRLDDFLDPASAIFETVLFGSGRPVLIATPTKKPVERFRTAVLAWDGSSHATRVLSSALALFPDLKSISIFTAAREGEESLVPASEIAAHIQRHDIETDVVSLNVRGEDQHVGVLIAEHAGRKNADLIVMGGYGHSRIREFILGGVTEYLSKVAPVPILLAH